MKLIIELLLTCSSSSCFSKFLPGVTVAGYTAAIIVAIVLAILNAFCKTNFSYFNITSNYCNFGLVFIGY